MHLPYISLLLPTVWSLERKYNQYVDFQTQNVRNCPGTFVWGEEGVEEGSSFRVNIELHIANCLITIAR